MTPDALTQTMQDVDAEVVEHLFPALYANIKEDIERGWKLERVEKQIASYFTDWKNGDYYRAVCKNAARSIHRKHQTELAREALVNICTGIDPIRCDDPNCPVHGSMK